MPTLRRGQNRLLANLMSIFSKADPDVIADLQDAIDNEGPLHSDIGSAPHARPSAGELNIGSPENASGYGAVEMVRRYSQDLKPGDDITRAYTALAEMLIETQDAVKAHDKALGSIGRTLAAAMGKSDAFPKGETDEKDEKSDEDEKDKAAKATNKANTLTVQSSSIPKLMATLMGTSRSHVDGSLVQPPDMMALSKAAIDLSDAVDNADWLSPPERIVAMELLQLRSAAAQGLVPHETYNYRLGAAPSAVRQAFGL